MRGAVMVVVMVVTVVVVMVVVMVLVVRVRVSGYHADVLWVPMYDVHLPASGEPSRWRQPRRQRRRTRAAA